jgi:hypothetical protein
LVAEYPQQELLAEGREMLDHDNEMSPDGSGDVLPRGVSKFQVDAKFNGSANGRSYLRMQVDHWSEVALLLVGEIDLMSMAAFEMTVGDIVAAKPSHLTFDARSCGFVSVSGLALIGECSQTIEKVTVYTKTDLASRVLGLLGYENVDCLRDISSDCEVATGEITAP